MALLGLGVAKEDVLFVDDQQRNIDGARGAGLEAQLFDVADVSTTVSRIRRRLDLENAVLAS